MLGSILLEDNQGGVISEPVGVYWEPAIGKLIFKVRHKLAKEDVRRTVRSYYCPRCNFTVDPEGPIADPLQGADPAPGFIACPKCEDHIGKTLKPLERPFVAADMNELAQRFQEGNFDGNDLDDVIHFLATMPGGGGQFLVARGSDPRPSITGITRGDLHKLKQLVAYAVMDREYRKHEDLENHLVVQNADGEFVDEEAFDMSEKAWQAVQAKIAKNPTTKFKGHYGVKKNAPEIPWYRKEVSSQLTLFYRDRMRAEAINAVQALVPGDFRGILLQNMRHSSDENTESFDIITKADKQRRSQDRENQEKEKALSKQIARANANATKMYADMEKEVENNFQAQDDPDDPLSMYTKYYTFFTEVEIDSKVAMFNIASAFLQSLSSGRVTALDKRFTTGDAVITSFGWNIEIDGLSEFVHNADKLSFHVDKEGTVYSYTDTLKLKKDNPHWDDPTRKPGAMSALITYGIRNAIKQHPVLGDYRPTLVQQIAGPLVVFTNPLFELPQ